LAEVVSEAPLPRAGDRPVAPTATPAPDIAIPERLGYRLKNVLLGPPLATERQSVERLGRPTALAILSSDVISSSAYSTEELLVPLVPVVGVAAFSLVVPITLAVLAVLVVVTLSYLEVVKVYTKAGGAYVVGRENFGPNVAQVAAVALLVDYTLTVAVSVAAGVAALTSVVPALRGTTATVAISIALVLLIAYVNLRGVREAGRIFAVPTYFFIVNMLVMLGVGFVRAGLGQLHAHPLHQPGAFSVGTSGHGLLLGASVFVVLRAFASGGSALTGTEAISNGVSVFRQPEAHNARITLGLVAGLLGTLVLGVAVLSAFVHPVPRTSGSPTVLAQVTQYVYGGGALGHALLWAMQAGTMMVLILAANTSFTGFPYLASFAAEDSYLPRQLTKRGHRLVFSTGIIVLTAASVILLLVTRAQVDSLIPLYAIGVFTGFTMAGAGMAKYHLVHREPQWRRRLVVNASAAVLSFVVDVIFAVTKFTEGAWVVVIVLPLGVFLLVRLHRQYAREDAQLEAGAAQACEAPVLRRHVVIVLVDRLDLATARALQYARTLHPDEVRAVHFAVDPAEAGELEVQWSRLGLSRMPLDIIDAPDRRLARAALVLAAETTADGATELSILLPRRGFTGGWRRLLHDRTADEITEAVSSLPHVNATIVPFQLTSQWPGRRLAERLRSDDRARPGPGRDATPGLAPVPGTIPVAEAAWRDRVRVAGRIRQVRVPTRRDNANLEVTLVDGTGAILLVFQGRRQIAGIQQGAKLVAQGTVGAWKGRLAILNPNYELLASPETEPSGAGH
jgi:amino acid transporter